MGWIADTFIIIVLVLFIWSGALSGFIDGFVRLLTIVIAIFMVIYGADLAIEKLGVPVGLPEDIAISVAAAALVLLTFLIGILLRKALHPPHTHASIAGSFIGFARGYFMIMCLVLASAVLPATWTKTTWGTSLTLPSIGFTASNMLSALPLPDSNIGKHLARVRITDNDNRPYLAQTQPAVISTEPQPELTADELEQQGVITIEDLVQ